MKIARVDHLVLTVASLKATCDFYNQVLGMEVVETPKRPTALFFGQQKINLHEAGHEFQPKAKKPTVGAGDFCLITEDSMADWLAHLDRLNVEIELGPVPRDGALGPMKSIYLRDPDYNCVEIACY